MGSESTLSHKGSAVKQFSIFDTRKDPSGFVLLIGYRESDAAQTRLVIFTDGDPQQQLEVYSKAYSTSAMVVLRTWHVSNARAAVNALKLCYQDDRLSDSYYGLRSLEVQELVSRDDASIESLIPQGLPWAA